jgi:hypothetical protein
MPSLSSYAGTRNVYIGSMFVGGKVGDDIAKYLGLRGKPKVGFPTSSYT